MNRRLLKILSPFLFSGGLSAAVLDFSENGLIPSVTYSGILQITPGHPQAVTPWVNFIPDSGAATSGVVPILGFSRGTLTINGTLNELPSFGNSVLTGNGVLLLGSSSWITSISGSGNSMADEIIGFSVIRSLAQSDPSKAANYLSMMESGDRDDAVRLALEQWTTQEDQTGRIETLSDRDRDRGGRPREESQDGLYGIGGEESMPPVWTSGANMIYADGVVASVPEPSFALLIGLGSLHLLVRRRRTS